MQPKRVVYTISSDVVFTELPDELRRHIERTLTIPNPEREDARRLQLAGWQALPETLRLYGVRDGVLVVPRGVEGHLREFLQVAEQAEIEVRDSTHTHHAELPALRVPLRAHQALAVQSIEQEKTGIYEAPPGSGKTVTALCAMSRTQQRSLVVVNTRNIAAQWADRCEQFLGFRPGIVGDGSWDESQPITIALNQTLASRINDLERDGWFDAWGFVCLDECHHVTASTFFSIMSRFSARWRIGVSATPDRDNGLVAVAYAVLGPLLHRTDKSELAGAGFLVRPRVVKVPTGFRHHYHSTHTADHNCAVPGCIKAGKHRHQNNYQQVIGALADDTDRNALIASLVSAHPTQANLVLSKRLGHLEQLREMVRGLGQFAPDRLFMLTGRESTEERMRVAEEADSGACVVFSTIADEALDVPRLDRLYLVWPTKNAAVIRQQVGRIERAHPSKKDAVVYDFVDADVAPLARQWAKRSIEVYAREGFEIST